MRDSLGNKTLYHLLIFFSVAFSVLVFKLFYIQVYSYSSFKKQASRQQVSEKKINYLINHRKRKISRNVFKNN